MGLLGDLFGSSKPKEVTVNGRTRPIPPRLAELSESDIVAYFELKDALGGPVRTLHPLKIVMKTVVLHGRAVGVAAAMCRPEAALVADLGFDLADVSDVARRIERLFNKRIDLADVGAADIRVGDLANLLAIQMGTLTIDVPATSTPEADPSADLVALGHVLRCARCQRASVFPPNDPNVNCQHCQTPLLNLGPLPTADLTINVGNMTADLVPDDDTCDLDALPKWACAYCGRNVGVRSVCERCGCDLSRTPPISLRAQLANASPEERAIYRTLASLDITDEAALCLLGRLTPERVVAIGGNASLAGRMTPIPRPPGAKEH